MLASAARVRCAFGQTRAPAGHIGNTSRKDFADVEVPGQGAIHLWRLFDSDDSPVLYAESVAKVRSIDPGPEVEGRAIDV